MHAGNLQIPPGNKLVIHFINGQLAIHKRDPLIRECDARSSRLEQGVGARGAKRLGSAGAE